MANLIACANGNLTSASSWGLVDSGSTLDSEAASTALSLSYVNSAVFVPGAITVDGIAVKLLNRVVSPSGTISLNLRNTTGSLDIATVTINVSDIPADSVTNNNGGWVFFKFSAPVLLIAATNYVVQLKASAGSGVSAYRDATAGNWSRMLRTTTTQAPAAGDQMLVCGEWTAAATVTGRTITMDQTSLATSYGNLNICLGGTLTWGTTASTNYALSLAGNLNIYGGGTWNMGTSGTPMPSTSSAVLEFNCGSNVQYGCEIYGGSINFYGNPLSNVKAKLGADASAAATALTTDISTGWKNGDEIAIAPTTRTASEGEKKTLGADASGTSIPTIAALTNAHGGNSTTKVQAELANLTRNVKIRGVSTSLQAYFNIRTPAVFTAQYAEFYQLGSATANKRGINLASAVTTVTGSYNISYCSFHDFIVTSSEGLFIGVNNATYLIQISNCIYYNTNEAGIYCSASTTNPSSFIDGCVFILNVTTAAALMHFAFGFIPFTNNAVSGSQATSATGGVYIGSIPNGLGLLDGCNIHSNNAGGIYSNMGSTSVLEFTNLTLWRNGTAGMTWPGQASISSNRVTWRGCLFFGNANAGIVINPSSYNNNDLSFLNCTFDAGVTLTQPVGVQANGSSSGGTLTLDGCSFGATNVHATADVQNAMHMKVTERNTVMASTTEYSNTNTSIGPTGYIAAERHDGTTGNHITRYRNGIVQIDTTIYDTTPSQRMTPNSNASLAYKLRSAPIRVPIGSGQTINISVKVRQSVVGDGATYNGNFPRLILMANGALGVTADVVAATGSAAGQGAFETLSYTSPTAGEDGVLTFYVDCDGTTGWINIDTVTVT